MHHLEAGEEVTKVGGESKKSIQNLNITITGSGDAAKDIVKAVEESFAVGSVSLYQGN